jgi:hypothetical protein
VAHVDTRVLSETVVVSVRLPLKVVEAAVFASIDDGAVSV